MKSINFVRIGGLYGEIIDTFVNPIIPFLPELQVSRDCLDDAINITFFVETNLYHPSGTTILMSHGIADKGWRNGNRVSKFNYVFVSGKKWLDKMLREGIPGERILVNGYTKLDPIFQGKIKKTPSDKKRILWAPTHNTTLKTTGTACSYPALESFFKRIPKEFEVLVSLHPANKSGKSPTLQLLADADIVVADSGSTLYEAWALGKQVVFPDWLIKNRIMQTHTFEREIFANNIGLHANNEKELMKLIEYGLEAPLSKETKEFIDGIFDPELRGKSGERTAELLKQVASR
jgi:UDP-N-acetylglucosamine 2-epimerase